MPLTMAAPAAFSRPVLSKARRLLAAGRVIPAGDDGMWLVKGEHGGYVVTVTYDHKSATCTCPAGRWSTATSTCSHTAAVLLAIREQPGADT